MVNYTNASTLIVEDYEDMDETGLFSGWNYRDRSLRHEPLALRGHAGNSPAVGGSKGAISGEAFSDRVEQYSDKEGFPSDETLQHPRSVFQILKRHYARYTPEMVERITGCPKEAFLKVAETICENSGRDKTSSICYSVGWTQHSKGAQLIRTAAILQLLLGNMGRPGGGILALRGHATIQGSTDIATLYNILPGYVAMPDANKTHDTWEDYTSTEAANTGWWSNFPAYATSIMKAWYGDAATPENDYLYDHFPRLNGDHSYYPTIMDMKDGKLDGCFVFGQNFAVGGPHAKLARDALRALDWLVILDAYEIETATVWKSDGVDPRENGTEVFFMPSALVAEKEGSFTQTQRMVQWHDKSVDPPGDARSDAWFVYHLGRKLKELYKDSENPRDSLVQAMVWDYPTHGEGTYEEPDLESVLKEINGYTVEDGEPLSTFLNIKDDGSTACGGLDLLGRLCRRREPGPPPQDRRIPAPRVGLGLAGKPPHPLQPRLGRPIRQALERGEKARLVGRGTREVGRHRRPGLPGRKTPGLPARSRGSGVGRAAGQRAVYRER